MSNKKIRILVLRCGPVTPPLDEKDDEYFWLSEKLCGDILIPAWGDKRFDTLTRRDFKYTMFKTWGLPQVVKQFVDISFLVIWGIKIYYFDKRKYKVIVSFGTNTTGIAALLLKFLTGTPLISEIPGNPSKSYLFDEPDVSLYYRMKFKLSRFLLKLCVNNSKITKLLYREQLDGFPELEKAEKRVFFAITPISHYEDIKLDNKYIFFLGCPWFLKGVDVLIRAFQLIKKDFPDINLKIAGYCDDRTLYENLRSDEDRIQFYKGLPHAEALDLISKCTIFVLPSRTEAMGKVLIEAMGYAKPVIASNVDGIPKIVKDNLNGYLFECGNYQDLAAKLSILLSDKELAKRLGEQGKEYALSELSEKKYIDLYYEMINYCC